LSNDLKTLAAFEGVNMMPEITNRHSKPACRIVVARTEFTGKQALLYTPPHSGNHQWRVGVAGTAGAIVRKTNFGCPPTLYGKSREIGAMLLYRCDVPTELPRRNIAWRLMPSCVDR
jgi:hypothetical protein